jgi:cytidylate kinase
MEHLPRSIEQIVDEQARRWQLGGRGRPGPPARPVIAVSRQHGAGGGRVARRLAEELALELYDREIIEQIARSTHLSARVVSELDERDRELLTDWLAALTTDSYLSPSAYCDHLTRVIGAIAVRGGAVILGRGAHLILGPARALRVQVIAPLAARVAEVAGREGLSERDARRRIAEVESERQAFLQRYFHIRGADPAAFDLVVNTGVLGVAGAVDAVRSAVGQLGARRSAAPSS